MLEVSEQSIYVWRRQERIDSGELPGLFSIEQEELRVARRRIEELETELGVHRRAAELLKETIERPTQPRTPRRTHLDNLHARIGIRLVCLAACITLSHQLGCPSRNLVSFTAEKPAESII